MNRPSRGSRGPEARLPRELLLPRAWPPGAGPVEFVETHISWVFLVGDLAYKVKKPVRLDFLDFSTPALRRHFCEEELRLNRRFAPALYLGLSQVVDTPAGLAVDRPGQVVDHAVRMRRFDRSQELDALLARQAIATAPLSEFGARLAHQHARSPVAGPAQPWATPARTLAACRENFAELGSLGDASLRARVGDLDAWTTQQYERLLPRLERRRAAGRWRECHGDLHCANVVRHDEELWAFDALEFDPGLHWIDVASDLAFLWMDLRARGHDGHAGSLLDGWLAGSGDFDALGVLRFYEAYRAGVRAKVAAIRLRQAPARRQEPEQELQRYLAAATRATLPAAPRLVATTGVSGSGKSWLAERLLGPLDAVRLRSDVERKRIAGLGPGARSDGTLYTAEMTRATYDRLEQLAGAALGDGFSVIVDAASLRLDERLRFSRLAARLGLPFRLLDVSADPATLRRRVAGRAALGLDASEATPDVLELQLAAREALGPEEAAHAIAVDTAGDVNVRALARSLLGGPAPAAG